MSGLHPKRVIVPIDFSESSLAALRQATDIVADDGELFAVHVLPSLTAMEPGNLYGTVTDKTRIEATEASMRQKLAEIGIQEIACHAFIGDAGRQITDFAERYQADMIVMPSHGRGFIKHLLLGSVAERVLRLAHCPVLVLRS